MGNKKRSFEENLHRRSYGIHLTSSDIFLNYIFPEIRSILWNYRWVDLYAGEGNLILPILNSIPLEERTAFFKDHIYLSDVQKDMIEKCILKAKTFGILDEVARNNIKLRNNLESFPAFLKNKHLPIFHITNPPYLYLGYIRKHKETQKYLKYFENINNGYQDLYQIAMINDLRNGIENLIYIIPSNFLYGASVSNKFRLDFLKYYDIQKMIIFETKIFEYTGTNICIGFFKKKQVPKSEIVEFSGVKIKKLDEKTKKKYRLRPKYKYRAGSEFDDFLEKYQVENSLSVNYYLMQKEIMNNQGKNVISVIDANSYQKNAYRKLKLQINDRLKEKIESNILYTRTVDTGSYNGRVGLGIILRDFKVDGIIVSGNTYRTHPIQIFFEPILTQSDQELLRIYFNFVLEYFREKLDSEFLTTYKYSNAEYTRKYLGLTQVRSLIKTLPVINMNLEDKAILHEIINMNNFDDLILFLKKFKKKQI
ncbi:MAG: N-6 DNA methylase [Promethearchaeota archaeon]|jgi:hypothetical protein